MRSFYGTMVVMINGTEPGKERRRTLLVAVLTLFLAFGGGIWFGTQGRTPFAGANSVSSLPPENVDFGPLYRAWRILEENYRAAGTDTEAVSGEERLWGAISGLAGSYDDAYTVFLPPEDKEIFESEVRGDFQGVGMEIGIRDDILTVIAPLKDTPAYRAGIESGDRIIEIDGESTAGITTEAAVKRIRGPQGTSITFTVLRGDQPAFPITVVRDVIELPTLETRLRDDGVFVIELYSFNALAPQLFRDAVAEFANARADKLVIDLRGNPGGFLEVAVDIASWFLPVGKVVVTEDYGDDARDRVHRSRGYDVFTDQLKLAILIDQGSASASEILAGALREHDIGIVVGATSFGKGSVQQIFDVTDEASLKITIAHWLTPDGTSISDGGITPDIEVEMTAEDREAGRDPQLERAAAYLLSL
ncbi:MAG: S41 family peptidase [Candidatus Paceibacteria bacterium]